MTVLIIGSEGAQGKRYQAILRYLGVQYYRADLGFQLSLFENIKNKLDGVIICTPTHTHLDVMRSIIPWGKPILVEKPVSTDVQKLYAFAKEIEAAKPDIQMIYQYQQLVKWPGRKLDTMYNYFRHGSDGLVWDCLQIIGLANADIDLAETSPQWNCIVNGQRLNIADMDWAYVKEIDDWLNKRKKRSLSEIIDIHWKVSEYDETYV